MANSKKAEVELEIDGETFTMVFDMAAIARFEDQTNLSIFAVLEQFADEEGRDPPKLSVMGAILEAGLHRHHPEIDRDAAMEMVVSPAGQEAMAKAFELAMPPADEGNAKAAKPKPPAKAKRKGSTGKRSRATRSKRA